MRAGTIIPVWGTTKRGIGIQRKEHISGNRYWWDVVHMKDGKIVLVHRDYPTKKEALAEARGYAQYERKNPGKGFLDIAGKPPRHN
jgi:hypothetical protein